MTRQAPDRSQPLPLWAQLEADLRRRLDSGEFDEGFFPTDLVLTEEYEVSRHTVREAIRHLNKTGVLKRERGRGTVVNRTEFEQSLGTLYSLFRSIEASGTDQYSQVVELEEVTDPIAADRLGLPEDTPLVLLGRVRCAGGEPLAIDRAWMPAAAARPLLELDFTHTALYDELAKIGAPVPNQGWERLTPMIPTPADRATLGMKRAEAAFFLERLGRRDDQPVEWRTTIIRGDRYRFVADWSDGGRGALLPATD
ncbi:MAG: GntR family transcriptional regulator [Acidimicrobiales bacterium]